MLYLLSRAGTAILHVLWRGLAARGRGFWRPGWCRALHATPSLGERTSLASLGGFVHCHPQAATPPWSDHNWVTICFVLARTLHLVILLSPGQRNQLKNYLLNNNFTVTIFHNFYYEIYHDGQRVCIVTTRSFKINNKTNGHIPTT